MDAAVRRGEGHPVVPRIKAVRGVTVVDGTPPAGPAPCRPVDVTDRKERIMPRLELGAIGATWRAALRRLDAWTLESMNSPVGGGRPRS
jgi:hypothetical protein